MKLLFITQYFPPEPEPGGYRILGFTKQLVRKGHQVTILTGMPSYPTGCLPSKYRNKLYVREDLEGIQVIRGYVYPAPSKSLSKRLLGFFTFACSSTLIGLLKRARYDAVFATSPPLFNGLSALFISRFVAGAKFIFDVRDLWPESAVVLGMLKDTRIIRLAEWLESFLYREADCIVTVTNGIRQKLIRRGFGESKIRVITNGVDVNAFEPLAPTDSWQIPNLKNRFVVTYAGTLGAAHGLESILDAASTMASCGDIRFLFVGDGADKDRLVKIKHERKLDNVVFLDLQEKEKMPLIWALSNVGLVSLKKIELFQAALPTKMFEVMACARPVLLVAEGEAKELIEAARAGICVEPGIPQRVAEAVMSLYQNPNLCTELGRNGRDFVIRHCSREILAHKLEELLQEVVE